MPQLDKLAYVSQVIWLIVVFMGMYFVLLYKSLPVIYKTLKFRRSKLSYIKENITELSREIFLIEKVTSNIVERFGLTLNKLSINLINILDLGLEEKKNRTKILLNRNRDFVLGSVLDNELSIRRLGLARSIDDNKFLGSIKNNLKKELIGLK